MKIKTPESGMGDGTEIPWDLSPGIGNGTWTDFHGTVPSRDSRQGAGTGTENPGT